MDKKNTGKNSIYEVHSLVSTVIYQPPQSNYMSEKSISGVRKYKHFHRRHLEFLRSVSMGLFPFHLLTWTHWTHSIYSSQLTFIKAWNRDMSMKNCNIPSKKEASCESGSSRTWDNSYPVQLLTVNNVHIYLLLICQPIVKLPCPCILY